MSMLEIVQFEDGKYGVRNSWTGIVLNKKFRTVRGAWRHIRRQTNSLNKAIARVQAR